MTTEQKSPISASERRNRLIRWASSNTLSMRNLALPAGMAAIVSRRMTSPFKQTKLCNKRLRIRYLVKTLIFFTGCCIAIVCPHLKHNKDVKIFKYLQQK